MHLSLALAHCSLPKRSQHLDPLGPDLNKLCPGAPSLFSPYRRGKHALTIIVIIDLINKVAVREDVRLQRILGNVGPSRIYLASVFSGVRVKSGQIADLI